MESETEVSPLIRTFSTPSRSRRLCRRIPSEVTITGIILGLFLLVVTLLIVLENMQSSSSSQEVLTLDSKLLASPLKSGGKITDKSSKDKNGKKSEVGDKELAKAKKWFEDWRKAYDLGDMKDTIEKLKAEKAMLELLERYLKYFKKTKKEGELEDILQDSSDNLLGSPFSYNKKALDTTWQEKKKQFITDPNSKKFDNVDKGFKKIYPLGTPFMVDREELDADPENFETILSSMKYEDSELDSLLAANREVFYEYLNKLYGQFSSMNLESVYDDDKTPQLGSPFMIDREEFDEYRNKLNEQFSSMNLGSLKEEAQKAPIGSALISELQKLYEEWIKPKNALKSGNKLGHLSEKMFGSSPNSLSNRTVAAPSGCPFAEDNSLLQAPSNPQSLANCALLAEDLRKTLGKCVDMSFLPKECKPSWRNKCFSTYRYRKMDGVCNNKIHPTWGQSGTPFVRMIAPDYSDGVSRVRTALSGGDLPNARFLSQKLYTKKMKPDIDVTLLFLSFGLVVDHDMVETAINAGGIPCCDDKYKDFPKSLPRACLPIDVPTDDPFYGPRNVKCLNFVRSMPTHGECMGRREQLNKATSFLDGSAIYGSTIQKAKSLRSFSKGQLRTQHINNTPFMAYSDGSGHNCGTPSEPLKCFTAGDSRVNMLVEQAAMHTLWYREHNRLAEELHKLNPQWTDEILFQEARRILVAELQHITYNEFLPLLLGEEAMEYFQLNVEPNGFYDGYDDTIDPSVYNSFGAAAFRFGHSLIKDMIDLVGPNNKTEGSVALHKTYFNPQILYHNGLDLLLRGAASQKLHSVDSFITNEVREHLFQPANRDFGHDLAAVGIQRGRDHGLPSYTKWRKACGLSSLNSWEDLPSVMNSERAKKLKEVYKSLEDIDLIPGALAENHADGSIIGPTYMCIIGQQFKKTRKGDRFWFEMQDTIGAFTKDQLREIYNSNMARIVCDNSDKIQSIQKIPFRVASLDNSVLNCQDIPKLDLSKWKADPLF